MNTSDTLSNIRKGWLSLICLPVCCLLMLTTACIRPTGSKNNGRDTATSAKPATTDSYTESGANRESAASASARQAAIARARAQLAEQQRLQGDITRPLFAGRISDERLLLKGGDVAEGQFGDYAIRNELIHAVITAPDHKLLGGPAGGVLADIGLRDRKIDFIRWYNPTANLTGNYDLADVSLEVSKDGTDGEVAEIIVRATTILPEGDRIGFETAYRLGPNDEALEIETTWTNSGTTSAPTFYPTDHVHWGATIPFIPRRGFIGFLAPQREEHESFWMAGVSDFEDFSLLLYSDSRAFYGQHLSLDSRVSYAFRAEDLQGLKPGASLSFKRYLHPGGKDFSRQAAAALDKQNISTAELFGRVVEGETNRPVEGAEVRLLEVVRQAGATPRPYSRAFTNDQGEFRFVVPPGEYANVTDARGRRSSRASTSFILERGASLEKLIRVSRPTLVDFEVRDEDTDELIPAKIIFGQARGSEFVSLGLPWEAPFSGNTYLSQTGKGRISLPVQRYRVTVSAGPEYTTDVIDLDVTKEARQKPISFKAKIKKIVPTEGWIASDIGVKTDASPGCLVDGEARLLAALCEGVEVLVVTDRNRLTDLRETRELLGLQEKVKLVGGVQFADPTRKLPGEFSVFPINLDTDPAKIGNVVSLMSEQESHADLFAMLRREFPGAMIQIDDPLHDETGYLKAMGFEYPVPQSRYINWKPEYSTDFDLVQVIKGRVGYENDVAEYLESWYQVLLTGHTAVRYTGGSGSERIYGEETGYPRIYVAMGDDSPEAFDTLEWARNVRAGAVQITMGPIFDFKVNDVLPGTMVEGRGDNYVYFDPFGLYGTKWTHPSALSIHPESGFSQKGFILVVEYPQLYPNPNDRRNLIRSRIARDTVFIAQTEKGKPLYPVLAQVSNNEALAPIPYVLTGPYIVDEDGDGVYTPPTPPKRLRD